MVHSLTLFVSTAFADGMSEQKISLPDFTMIKPTVEDIIALVMHLTGKPPSPDAITRMKDQFRATGLPAK